MAALKFTTTVPSVTESSVSIHSAANRHFSQHDSRKHAGSIPGTIWNNVFRVTESQVRTYMNSKTSMQMAHHRHFPVDTPFPALYSAPREPGHESLATSPPPVAASAVRVGLATSQENLPVDSDSVLKQIQMMVKCSGIEFISLIERIAPSVRWKGSDNSL